MSIIRFEHCLDSSMRNCELRRKLLPLATHRRLNTPLPTALCDAFSPRSRIWSRRTRFCLVSSDMIHHQLFMWKRTSFLLYRSNRINGSRYFRLNVNGRAFIRLFTRLFPLPGCTFETRYSDNEQVWTDKIGKWRQKRSNQKAVGLSSNSRQFC